jgi:hypothetical protein
MKRFSPLCDAPLLLEDKARINSLLAEILSYEH